MNRWKISLESYQRDIWVHEYVLYGATESKCSCFFTQIQPILNLIDELADIRKFIYEFSRISKDSRAVYKNGGYVVDITVTTVRLSCEYILHENQINAT